MKILLFVTSIYDTFENITSDDFKKIIDLLEEIAEKEDIDKVLISFCDETENKNLYTYFFRNIINYIQEKNIFLGNQFLGDVYYKDFMYGGALLYNESFKKEVQISKYVDELSKNNNVHLIYFDHNINIEKINDIFINNSNVNIDIMNSKDSEIIDKLIYLKNSNLGYEYKKNVNL